MSDHQREWVESIGCFRCHRKMLVRRRRRREAPRVDQQNFSLDDFGGWKSACRAGRAVLPPAMIPRLAPTHPSRMVRRQKRHRAWRGTCPRGQFGDRSRPCPVNSAKVTRLHRLLPAEFFKGNVIGERCGPIAGHVEERWHGSEKSYRKFEAAGGRVDRSCEKSNWS